MPTEKSQGRASSNV